MGNAMSEIKYYMDASKEIKSNRMILSLIWLISTSLPQSLMHS